MADYRVSIQHERHYNLADVIAVGMQMLGITGAEIEVEEVLDNADQNR